MGARCGAYAAERGVRLIGDIPIYVAEGSADTLAHPEIFKRGVVAGVPPDAFTDKGQLWGNPVYDWPALRRSGYAWWIARFRRVFELFDLARIDHFRGFVAYWGVPAAAEFALEGAWKRGPGRAPFDAARAALGELPLIAEDLGVITPPVKRLRLSLGPARAWPCCSSASRRPSATPSTCSPNHVENQVVYTGTHDNDTIRGVVRGPVGRRARAARRGARAPGHHGPRAALGADPARVRVPGAGGDGAVSRTCSGSARRAA